MVCTERDWSVVSSNRRRAVGFKSRALGLRSLASFESLRLPLADVSSLCLVPCFRFLLRAPPGWPTSRSTTPTSTSTNTTSTGEQRLRQRAGSGGQTRWSGAAELCVALRGWQEVGRHWRVRQRHTRQFTTAPRTRLDDWRGESPETPPTGLREYVLG